MPAGANFPTMTYQLDVVHDPNDATLPAATWTDLSTRVLTSVDGGGGWKVTRGRSFEFAHADPALADMWFRNDDGALTPGNVASPYNPLKLMRQLQILAAYGTNLLARNAAHFTEDTAGWAAGANTTAAPDLTRGFGAPGCLSLTAVAAGSVTATTVTAVPVTAGQSYCGWVAALAAATPRAVTVTINWLTAGGAANGSVAAAVGNDATVWVQSGSLSFGVAPALTTQAQLQVTVAGCALGETHCFDLVGIFPGASVKAWTPPAAESPYTVYTGYVERWTQRRDVDGVYPYVAPVVVDAMSPLAGVELLSAYDSEVLLDVPFAYYPCSEPPAAGSAGNISAYAQAPAPILTSKAGGTSVFGDSSSTPLSWEDPPPTALHSTVSATNNQSSGGISPPLQLPDAPFTIEMLCRIDAVAGNTPATGGFMFRSLVGTGLDLHQLIITNAGISWTVIDQNRLSSTHVTNVGPTTLIGDGKWHHLVVGVKADRRTGFVVIDGATFTDAIPPAGDLTFPTGMRIVAGGAAISKLTGPGVTGGLANVAIYNGELSATRIAAHYQAFSTGFSGESTDARIARILNYIPWYGPRALSAGATIEGPAYGLAGKSAVSAVQDVGDVDESGVVFVNAAGATAFRGRHYAQALAYPRFIFGENDIAGEIPYLDDIELDDDIAQVTNTAQVDQHGGSSVYAVNAPSMRQYFPRAAGTVTVNTVTTQEVEDRVNWLVSDNAYGQPRLRVTRLRFKPSNLRPSRVPLAWWAALSLEIGDPVRVMARPIGGATSQVDCVVDQIIPTVGDAPGEWTVELRLSPLIHPWILAGLRTQLNAASLAAATTLVVKALPDAASNPVEAVLRPGALLDLIDPGVTERVGVLTVTSSAPGLTGYTTVTLGVRGVLGTGALTADPGISQVGTGTLTLAANSPAGTATVIVDGEIMGVTAGAGTASLTVTRGPNGNGTSQAPHPSGTTVTFLAATGAVSAHPAGTVVAEPLSATPDGRTVRNPARWDAYAVIGALATTLTASSIAGSTSVALAALPDWPTNPPAGSIAPGDTLTVGPNLAGKENVVVGSVGPPTATGGATVTLGSRLAVAALAGAVSVRVVGTGTQWLAGQTVKPTNAAGATETKTVTTVTDNGDGTVTLGVAALTNAYEAGNSVVQGLKNAHTSGDAVCEPLPAGVNVPSGITPTAVMAY